MERPFRGSRSSMPSPSAVRRQPWCQLLIRRDLQGADSRDPIAGVRCRPSRSVAVVLDVDRSPLDLCLLPGGSSGISLARAPVQFVRIVGGVPRDLRLVRSATSRPEIRCRRCRGLVSRLSWDSLLVCESKSPCRRHPLHASTPSNVAAAFGQLGSRLANSFRPRGFAPPRRLSPHADSWACCIPLPARIRRVSTPLLPLAARAIREDDLALRPVSLGLSRCAFHTPRRSPPECSRVASLRPLPPRRCACARLLSEDNFRSPTLDLEALLRVRVRCDHPLLPGDDRPLLPWASFPSRVLTRAARSDP